MDKSELFKERMEKHDRLEAEVMNNIRRYTDRKHLPDRRVSFCGVPVSWDLKTTCNVEKAAHDEYFRLMNEGEYVFIVYQSNDQQLLADWITNLSWAGPFEASINSTCGDDYYRISGGIDYIKFVQKLQSPFEYPYLNADY